MPHLRRVGDLFDDYALATPFGRVAWDEMFEAPGVPRPAAQDLFEVLQATAARGLRVARQRPRPGLPRPWRHLPAVGRGAPVPARPGAEGHRPTTEWGALSAGVRPAGEGARGAPRRPVRKGPDPRRRGPAPASGHQLRPFPPGGLRASSRPTACASTSPASTSSGATTAGSGCSRTTSAARRASPTCSRTGASWPASSRSCSRATGSCRSTTTPAELLEALRAAAPPGRRRSDRGRAHPGGLQLGLLRALLPGPPDGRRTGRGPGPRLPAHRVVHAHHRAERSGSTSSTAGSTTTSSTRCTSGRTPSSAAPGSSTPPGRATSRSPTRSATAWPTTS